MARKRDATNSIFLIFDPGGISITNWRIIYQESELNKDSRGEKK